MSFEKLPPIADGVVHGPYREGGPFSQSRGLFSAIEEALETGRISEKTYRTLHEGAEDLEWVERELTIAASIRRHYPGASEEEIEDRIQAVLDRVSQDAFELGDYYR